MYQVVQIPTLHQLEHYLNVSMPEGSEVISVSVLEFGHAHEYLLIFKAKKNATQAS